MKQIIFPASNRFYLRALLASLCLMLGACASQAGLWLKDNSTQLQVDQDNYACLQQSQQPYGYSDGGFGWGPGWGGSITLEDTGKNFVTEGVVPGWLVFDITERSDAESRRDSDKAEPSR